MVQRLKWDALGYEKEGDLRSPTREGRVQRFRKKTKGSLEAVTLDFNDEDRIVVRVRKYGNAEREDDGVVSIILEILRRHFDRESIVIDSPLGQVST